MNDIKSTTLKLVQFGEYNTYTMNDVESASI